MLALNVMTCAMTVALIPTFCLLKAQSKHQSQCDIKLFCCWKKLSLKKMRGNINYSITKENELIKFIYYFVNFPPLATVTIPQFAVCCCKLTSTNYVI